jgi:hypothetical protein
MSKIVLQFNNPNASKDRFFAEAKHGGVASILAQHAQDWSRSVKDNCGGASSLSKRFEFDFFEPVKPSLSKLIFFIL